LMIGHWSATRPQVVHDGQRGREVEPTFVSGASRTGVARTVTVVEYRPPPSVARPSSTGYSRRPETTAGLRGAVCASTQCAGAEAASRIRATPGHDDAPRRHGCEAVRPGSSSAWTPRVARCGSSPPNRGAEAYPAKRPLESCPRPEQRRLRCGFLPCVDGRLTFRR
jgi:hypothetical protein